MQKVIVEIVKEDAKLIFDPPLKDSKVAKKENEIARLVGVAITNFFGSAGKKKGLLIHISNNIVKHINQFSDSESLELAFKSKAKELGIKKVNDNDFETGFIKLPGGGSLSISWI